MVGNDTSLGTNVNKFHWADYLVFGASLAFSLGIGAYFAIVDRHKNSTEEFLMGGRKVHFFPVGLSLLGSILNGVFVIGAPSEVYYFGPVYILIGVGHIIVLCVINTFFIPTFHSMRITSAYEYFDRRYSFKALRIAVSLTFMLAMCYVIPSTLWLVIFVVLLLTRSEREPSSPQVHLLMLFFLAVVLYVPALAFSEVAQMNLYVAIVGCGVVCTIYTGLGGVKAVIWTDTVQMCIICVGLLVLCVCGIYSDDIGGPSVVMDRIKDGGRSDFGVWDTDPRKRHTVWTQVIGQPVIWISVFATNQMMIQRYLTTASPRAAQLAMIVALSGVWVGLALVCVLGFTIYAYYITKCDPLFEGIIEKGDQLVPRFLMEIVGKYHGLPGLFTAAVFAAALSSVSSAINSMAAVVLEDFARPLHKSITGQQLSMPTATKLTRALGIFFGLTAVGLSAAAEYMGDRIIDIPATIWGTAGAPLLGCFCMGIFIPWSTGLGSFVGLLVSLVLTLWMSIGGVMEGSPRKPKLPLAICNAPPLTEQAKHDLQYFYDISYAWYGLIAFATQMVVGLLFSAVENWVMRNRQSPDPRLMYNCAKCGLCFFALEGPNDPESTPTPSNKGMDVKVHNHEPSGIPNSALSTDPAEDSNDSLSNVLKSPAYDDSSVVFGELPKIGSGRTRIPVTYLRAKTP